MKTILFLALLLSGCASVKKDKIAPSETNHNLANQEISGLFFNANYDEVKKAIEDKVIDPKKDRGIFSNSLSHEVTENLELLKLVIQKGSPLDEKNELGDTPLSIAVKKKEIDSINFLIKSGANPNDRFSFNDSLFHIAVQTNHLPTIEALISHQVCPLILGFIDVPLIEKTPENLKSKINDYIDWYSKNIGQNCEVIKK